VEDKYKSYSSSELASDDAFIRWVMNGENHQQWTQWQNKYPELAAAAEEAKYIVRSMAAIHLDVLDKTSKMELWDRIRTNISLSQHKTTFQKQYRILKWTLAVAATFALIIWISTARELRKVVVHSGGKEEISLPEKSIVTINAGSKVTYNKSKFRVEREIRLEGEAFFNVNPGSKFTVITQQGTVAVMGTSFNVISRPGQFEVSCYTGKVNVVQGQNDKMEITGGEKCYADKMKEKLKLKTFDPSLTAPGWIQGKFTFEDQPLSVVFGELERQYGVKVKLEKGIEDMRYNGLFESGDLKEALRLITWPLHLKAEVSGKSISISR
jgi:transmembrane sensor